MPAQPQAAGLDTRLSHAEHTLAALTPPRGRGTRQIPDEATLVAAIALVLTEQRVEGLLSVTGEKQVEQPTQDGGRGRGSQSRSKRVVEPTRSHSTRLARQADTMAQCPHRFGWKALVTKAGQPRRSWQEAVVCYRQAYRVERVGNRLTSRGPIAPLFVKLNAHMEGLTSLLTLGVRV